MGLQDRDFMSKDHEWLARLQRRRRWQRIRWMPVIGISTAVLGLGSVAIWFLRDAASLPRIFGRAEGSLVVNVNVNTASAHDLQSLPGIGPALARRIIGGRPYATVDELARVRGISPSMVQGLGSLVAVEGETLRAEGR
jgi:competence protein ComEA